MLYCKNCGAQVGENDMFCTSCSARLNSGNTVSRACLSRMAAENADFSPDGIADIDLTGSSVMNMRLTDKLFSFAGADHYRAVIASGEECVPLMVRHMIFPDRNDRDRLTLMNGSPDSFGRFAELFSKECKTFSAACAAAGIPSLNYRCDIQYSKLYDEYHIFTLMEQAVPLPLYLRQNKTTVRDALRICAEASSQLVKLNKGNISFGSFSDNMIFVGTADTEHKVYLDCRIPLCCSQAGVGSRPPGYYGRFVSPDGQALELYSLAMTLYMALSGSRSPYVSGGGPLSDEQLAQAEMRRMQAEEPFPPDRLENTVGITLCDIISCSPHNITLSEFSRILYNSLNYVNAAELNEIIGFDRKTVI